MIPVFYSRIRPADGQEVVDVIRRAQAMGYALMPFAGWSDADLGYAGNPGPNRATAKTNRARCVEIQDACEVRGDWPLIITADQPDLY